MTTSFEEETAIKEVSPGNYRANLHKKWWVVRGPHGGYLASIGLRALKAAVGDSERHIRSLTVHYFSAPNEGEMELETAVERTGGSLTNATARMTQEGRNVGIVLGVFSKPWTGAEFFDAKPPEVPALRKAFKIPHDGADVPPFLRNFDMRWGLGAAPFSGSKEAVVGGWFRMAEPQVADDVVVATYMDAWPPVMFPVVTEPIVAPTLDLTVHFRRELPLTDVGPDDHFVGRFFSHMSHDGFFEEDGELWTADGRLVAQSRQLALSLPIKRD